MITVVHLTLNMFWKPPPIAVGKYNPLALITVKSGYNADYRSRLASVKIAKLVYPVKALVKPSMLRVFPAAFCLNLGWTWWNLGHFWHNQDALVPSSMLNHHDHDHHNLYKHNSYHHHHHHDHDHQTCLCLLAWSPSRQTEHALTFRRHRAISSCNRDLLNTHNQNQPEVEEYKIQSTTDCLCKDSVDFDKNSNDSYSTQTSLSHQNKVDHIKKITAAKVGRKGCHRVGGSNSKMGRLWAWVDGCIPNSCTL